MSAARRPVATGRRPDYPARRLGRPRSALAAGTGIHVAGVTLVRQLTVRPGGEAWLARAGGRPVIVAWVCSEPGPRVVCRLPIDPPWAVEHLVEVFCRAAPPA